MPKISNSRFFILIGLAKKMFNYMMMEVNYAESSLVSLKNSLIFKKVSFTFMKIKNKALS